MKRRFLSKEHRVSSTGVDKTEHPCSLLPPLDPGWIQVGEVPNAAAGGYDSGHYIEVDGGKMKNRNLRVPEESWERKGGTFQQV